MNTPEQKDFVRNLVIASKIHRDSLPYHTEFDVLFTKYAESGFPELTKNRFWEMILQSTESGEVEGEEQQADPQTLPLVPLTTDEEAFAVLAFLHNTRGTRKRLPYTAEFDIMYQQFTSHFKRHLTKNDFWHLLSSVIKRARRPRVGEISPSHSLSTELIENLHTMNPWWQGKILREIFPFQRPLYNKIFKGLQQSRPQIHMLRGPRQVGKSTFQEQMIFDLLHLRSPNLRGPILAKQIFHVSFDKITVLPPGDPIITIIRWYANNVVQDGFNDMRKKGKPIYIFLDEVQDVDNWSVQLKHIVDFQECHIFATGSSALKIAQGKANLPGRAAWHQLSVLGLSEIAQMRGMGSLQPYTEGNNREAWRQKDFWVGLATHGNDTLLLDAVYEKFSDLGGYPYCHCENRTWNDVEGFLEETVIGRTIEYDILAKFHQTGQEQTSQLDSAMLTKFFSVLCKWNGHDVTIKHLHKELAQGHSINLKHDQIRTCLDFFADSMLVNILKPDEHRFKTAYEQVKICLCDHALRRAEMGESISLIDNGVNANLAGYIVEGIVGSFLSSFSNLNVSYFPRSGEKHEVDFVVTIGDFRIPIEVKYQNSPTVSEGIKQYLARPQHNTKFGLLLTKDTHWVHDNIVAIPMKNFLLLK